MDFLYFCHAGGFDDNDNDDGFGAEASFDDDDAGGDMDMTTLARAAAEGAFQGGGGSWQSIDQVRTRSCNLHIVW